MDSLAVLQRDWLENQGMTLGGVELYLEEMPLESSISQTVESQMEVRNVHYMTTVSERPYLQNLINLRNENSLSVQNEIMEELQKSFPIQNLETSFPIQNLEPQTSFPVVEIAPLEAHQQMHCSRPLKGYSMGSNKIMAFHGGNEGGGNNWHSGGNNGGNNWHSGGSGESSNWGSNEGNAVFVFLLYGGVLCVFLIFVQKAYGFLLIRFERATYNLKKYLDGLKNSSDIPTRFYVICAKGIALLTALLAGPEAFLIALRTFSNPVVRRILRLVRFLARMTFVVSFFVGGTFYGLSLYKLVISVVEPLLDQMVNILSGPANVSLTILFLEKLVKTVMCSYVASCILVGFQKWASGKMKIFRLFVIVCLGALSCYLILKDFTYLRPFCLFLGKQKMVSSLISCQLGRFAIVVGVTYGLKQLKGFSILAPFYVAVLYVFGIYSLVFSSTSNLFPR